MWVLQCIYLCLCTPVFISHFISLSCQFVREPLASGASHVANGPVSFMLDTCIAMCRASAGMAAGDDQPGNSARHDLQKNIDTSERSLPQLSKMLDQDFTHELGESNGHCDWRKQVRPQAATSASSSLDMSTIDIQLVDAQVQDQEKKRRLLGRP